MVTLFIAERGESIVSLLKTGCAGKKIIGCHSLQDVQCDYMLTTPASNHCDVVLHHNRINSTLADYMTIMNTDETHGGRINKKVPILTYGLNPLATVTASSICVEEGCMAFFCCLQRSIVTLQGKIIEPQEISMRLPTEDISAGLAFAALGLVLSFAPKDFLLI